MAHVKHTDRNEVDPNRNFQIWSTEFNVCISDVFNTYHCSKTQTYLHVIEKWRHSRGGSGNFKESDLFPLTRTNFHDNQIKVPHNAIVYLKAAYGDNVMKCAAFHDHGIGNHVEYEITNFNPIKLS